MLPNDQTVEALRSKHPEAPSPEPVSITPPSVAPISVDEETVLKAVRNMRSGSCGGLDGMRPIYLQDMLSPETADSGKKLLSNLTRLINQMLAGQVPEYCVNALFGASLLALEKEDGGVRPIAIGCLYRRLAAKIAAKYAAEKLNKELCPIQLGVGVSGGCESAAHSLRHYASGVANSQDTILVKADIRNAFNTVHRSAVLQQVKARCPEIFPLMALSYSNPTPLYIGTSTIMSQTGVQQGDPLGPLGFTLAIDPTIRSLDCPLNMWYLDDGSVAGPADLVIKSLKKLTSSFRELGLEMNPSKCEVASLSNYCRPKVLTDLRITVPNIKVMDKHSLTLLNSPVYSEAIPKALEKTKHLISNLCNRIKGLDAHTALFFLTHHSSAPRLNYLLRSAPMFLHSSSLLEIDDMIRRTTVEVTNVRIDDTAWKQASLPVRFGGLGLRQVEKLALPCYLSSIAKSETLVKQIVPNSITQVLMADVEERLQNQFPNLKSPEGEKRLLQKSWDEAVCGTELDNLHSSAHQVDSARLHAAASPHSGAWLDALPIPNLGLHLDNESVRIAVALRLGAPICQPHKCRCGRQVDSRGLHGLSCQKSAGRLPRHAHVNDIVKRSLSAAGVPARLEPVGLDRGNSKRPDGITLFPFTHGQHLCWDATISDTFSASVINDSASKAGSAADRAEKRKINHYSNLLDRYRFTPISFETTGVYGKQTEDFIAELGRRIRGNTGELRATQWLRQRLSLAIARGNSASILATGNFN